MLRLLPSAFQVNLHNLFHQNWSGGYLGCLQTTEMAEGLVKKNCTYVNSNSYKMVPRIHHYIECCGWEQQLLHMLCSFWHFNNIITNTLTTEVHSGHCFICFFSHFVFFFFFQFCITMYIFSGQIISFSLNYINYLRPTLSKQWKFCPWKVWKCESKSNKEARKEEAKTWI